MIELILQYPFIAAILALVTLGIVFGAILGFASVKFHVDGDPIADQINNLLPQTQCGQCGYPGCKPYAEAIANGDEINKCVPGGQDTIQHLAELLGVEAKPLDAEEKVPSYAYVREEECIGCTKCLQACPVDAIVGAAKQMHTVLRSECTGCDLCVEPCPVNCIEMRPIETTVQTWSWELPKPAHTTQIIATDAPASASRTEEAA